MCFDEKFVVSLACRGGIRLKRAIIIVLDSFGIGELPDAAKFGDEGSNTLESVAKAFDNFRLKNLEMLGLGNIEGVKVLPVVADAMGSYGRMAEKSPGKDTTTGHWEIAGLVLDRPFPTYPEGFPDEVIKEFEEAAGVKTLGNVAASGTEIINRLGDQHVKTGYPIVYTSADSVFQIAAHEEVIPVERLYEMCRIARRILRGEHAVGRVIARPFTGESGNYVRTERRHDFSLKPLGKTMLDYAKENGYEVKAVGKIKDIFDGEGITDYVYTSGNMDGVDKTLDYMRQNFQGIIFTNLVDFDMIYGHRNNAKGYAEALISFDNRIPELVEAMKEEDILFITADHGCDPGTPSTDHSREYVPLLVTGKNVKRNVNLGTRSTFADLSATVAEFLGIPSTPNGESFYRSIINK